MNRPTLRAVLLVALVVALPAAATGPRHTPGSAAPARAGAQHCPVAEAPDCCHCADDCATPPATRALPPDLSDMLEAHFLSVQAEPAPGPGRS